LLGAAKVEKWAPSNASPENAALHNNYNVVAQENTDDAAAPTAQERREFFDEQKLKPTSRAEKRIRAYNTDMGRKIRRTGHHRAIEIGKTTFQSGKNKDGVRYLQATCALCNTNGATMKCPTCEVSLHTTSRSGVVTGESCFQRWHTLKQIKKADFVKKRKSLDENKRNSQANAA
jgi:hypothetical protein